MRQIDPQRHQELYSGLLRLHILHHAAKEPIFGMGMIAELQRHGYRIGPGTMYPLLHGMERKCLLRSTESVRAGRMRRLYRATAAGRVALVAAREQVQELFGELFEDMPRSTVVPGIKNRDPRARRAGSRRGRIR